MKIHELPAAPRQEACERAAEILDEHPDHGVYLPDVSVPIINRSLANHGLAGRFRCVSFRGGVLLTKVTS